MYLKKVVLHNIGLFTHYEQEFTQGLVGIFGANGAGKTTLVNSIYAALTNDFRRFQGVKSDLICDMAGAKESSYIEVTAEHDNEEFVIRRSLRPNKSELTLVTAGKCITNAADIEKRLQTDLGVDMAIIDSHVFVNQWKMFDFLNQTPAVRADAYKHLCRTEKAEVIFNACNKMLAENALSAEIVDNSDELMMAIASAESTIEELEAKSSLHASRLLNAKSIASGKKLLRRRERHTELTEELNELQSTKIPVRERKFQKAEKLFNKSLVSLEARKQKLAGMAATVAEARAALQGWKTYEKRRDRRISLAADLRELRAQGVENNPPRTPADYAKRDSVDQKRVLVEASIEQASTIIAAFEKIGSGDCPTCHQKIDEAFVESQRKLLTKQQPWLDQAKAFLRGCRRYDELLQEFNDWKIEHDADFKAAEAELATLNDLTEPDGDRDALQAIVDQHTKLATEVNAAQRAHDVLKTDLNAKETRLTVAVNRANDIKKILEKIVVPEKIFRKVSDRLAEHQAAELEISNIDGQLTTIRQTLKENVASLEKLRAMMQRRKKLQGAMKLLEKVRDVFHWNCLPWQVAQGNLIRMQDDINEAMGWFGDMFWAEADEKLSFKIHFPGRPPRSAESLSGGQKGIFAIAFRRGVNSLFNTDIGTMFLDEPTAGLDEDNVDLFAEALLRLAAEVRGKRQLVIVTHAAHLRSSFDQVIDVGA